MDEPRDQVDDRFQRFYRDNFTHTTRLARLLTNRPDVADDLAQDAFVRVYRYAQNADRPVDNPAALLRTTTVNVPVMAHVAEAPPTSHGTARPQPDSLTEWDREPDHSPVAFPTTNAQSSSCATGSASANRRSPSRSIADQEPSSPASLASCEPSERN